jgi:predicted metal-dependent peptidase
MSDIFIKARAKLVLDNPFFGTLCLRLKPVQWEQPTGATDGVHLFYNLKWFEKLNELQRVGFLAHEFMHVVLMHHTRRQERQPERWNVAADYVINNHLLKENFFLPDGGLVDSQYDDMTTEHVYSLLPEQDTKHPDPGKCGGVLDHPTANSIDSKGAVEAQLAVAVNQAAEAARACGKLSANLEELVGEVVQPKVNWKAVLARFLRSNNNSDFTWQRPNRRFIGRGIYLPSMHNPCLDEIAVVSDTSGSRTAEELNQDLSEVSSILRDLNPNRVHFIQCDADVTDYKEYTRESLPLEVAFVGRGGTRFSPAIEYINKNFPTVQACIYLTDLCSDDFGKAPGYPVIWITTHTGDAPYGEIIEM